MMKFHGTTILAVNYKGKMAVAGDGQVTLNNSVVKHHARKVRRIYNDRIVVGFAGATADALTLSEKLESKLERYNGNLIRAKNGLEAIEIFKKHPEINIIIMDLKMPLMNGYDASKEIRKLNDKVTIIALTAFAMSEDRSLDTEANFQDYISKPVTRDVIFKALKKYIH